LKSRASSEVGWLNGVFVATKETKLIFDPLHSGSAVGAHVFISHAHADHTYGFKVKAKKYSSAETKGIHEAVAGRCVPDSFCFRAVEKVRIGDVEVVPLNSGHMLGSMQFKILLPDRVVVYTGDINCIDTLTTRSAEIAGCDDLIVEGTYGDPNCIFPPREKIYADIVRWVMQQVKNNLVPTFHVYTAGKAQEMVKLLNTYTNIPVVVHPTIAKVNEVYGESGVKLRYLNALEPEGIDTLRKGGCVYVTRQNMNTTLPEKAVSALATGWAIRKRWRSSAFPLSSHADFKQLVNFVVETHAKNVYVFTGYTETLSSYLESKFKVKARPILPLTQRRLGEF